MGIEHSRAQAGEEVDGCSLFCSVPAGRRIGVGAVLNCGWVLSEDACGAWILVTALSVDKAEQGKHLPDSR